MIPQQCLSCQLDVLVNFRQIVALSFGAFIVDFKYYFFIVNVIKCYLMTYLCGKPKSHYIYGSIVTKQFPTVPMTSPMGCSSEIFVYKLLW